MHFYVLVILTIASHCTAFGTVYTPCISFIMAFSAYGVALEYLARVLYGPKYQHSILRLHQVAESSLVTTLILPLVRTNKVYHTITYMQESNTGNYEQDETVWDG